MVPFFVYVFLSSLLSIYLVVKARPSYPFIAFIICLWVFTGDVANMDGIKISLGAFDLQPLRILFLLSLAFLIADPLIKQYKKSSSNNSKLIVNPTYERYLLIYVFLVLISYIINAQLFTSTELVAAITTALSFPLIYFTVKRATDDGFIEAFKNALFWVAGISSIVAIYQFVGDQTFFRVDTDFSRTAFGGFTRSTGVFRDDYIHAYVVFTALVWSFFSLKNGTKKYVLMGLFLIGIFVGFMRMGYVVTAFFMVHAILFATSATKKLKVLIVSLSSISAVLLVFAVFTSGVLESKMAQDRMMDGDTMELRFKLYQEGVTASFSELQGMLFGYGNTKSSAYYDSMYKATGGQTSWAMGEVGSWHNLLVEILFFNGLPALVFFLLFIINFLKYFFSLSRRYNSYHYYVPAYILTGYIIANLTLDLGLENPFATILGISAGLAVGKRTDQLQTKEVHDLKAV